MYVVYWKDTKDTASKPFQSFTEAKAYLRRYIKSVPWFSEEPSGKPFEIHKLDQNSQVSSF